MHPKGKIVRFGLDARAGRTKNVGQLQGGGSLTGASPVRVLG